MLGHFFFVFNRDGAKSSSVDKTEIRVRGSGALCGILPVQMNGIWVWIHSDS